MKIITTLILICSVNLIIAQNSFDLNGVKKCISISNQLNKSDQRAFNIRPDTLTFFFVEPGSNEEEIQGVYFIEYENGMVSRMKVHLELDEYVEVTYNYEAGKLIGGIIELFDGTTPVDFGTFTQTFDGYGRLISYKFYNDGQLYGGDSLAIIYDGDKIVSYSLYEFDETSGTLINTENFSDIQYENNDIIAYEFSNYVNLEEDPYWEKSRYTNVKFVADYQKYFFEPIGNEVLYDSMTISYYLSPEDGGSYGYPSPAGYVREDYNEDNDVYIKTHEQTLAYVTDHYNIDIKDVLSGEVLATDRIYLNPDGKMEKILFEEGGYLTYEASREFEYNEHDRLSSAKELNDLGIVTSSATFFYTLDDEDNLIKYAELTFLLGFGQYASGMILGYKNVSGNDKWSDAGLLKCFPSPFKNEIIVSVPDNINDGTVIRVYNSLGVLINNAEISGEEDILNLDTQHYPSGAYFLIIENKGKRYSSQLIKM